MKLMASTTSPFARKVTMLLHEKGGLDRVEIDYLDPWQVPERLVATNPLSKVPTLVLDDHRIIIDSDVICEYLDRHLPGPRLLPESGDAYWHVRALEALASGMLEASVAVFLETQRRPEEYRWPDWVGFQRNTISRTLDVLEVQAENLAAGFDYSAICVVAAMGHIEYRQTLPGWRDGRKRLAAWYDGVQLRPSVAATVPVEPPRVASADE